MGSIPLPALAIQTAPAPRTPLEEYARSAQLQMQQAQLAAQQQRTQQEQQAFPVAQEQAQATLQGTQQENQQRQIQLQEQQAMMGAAPQFVTRDDNGKPTGFDMQGWVQHLSETGKVSPQTLASVQQNYAKGVTDLANASEAQIKLQDERNGKIFGMLEDIRPLTDPAKRQTAYQTTLMKAAQMGEDIRSFPTQAPDNDTLTQYEIPLGMHAQALKDAQTHSEIIKNLRGTPDEAALSAWLAANPSKTAADYPAAKAASVANAEIPAKAATARADAIARQEAAQGDPAVAGEMLAKGDLTLADLKSRGTTPQFITKAVTAAQKINSTYNPADEVIAEQVAKSPSANQFFGSANSLITKGGTLDQLEKLGKNIPEHDFPVLNTIDDWQELARGKGPLAGYAATALGAADDYGKVMGGGTASDHARDAALTLFSKAASPEMRAQAIAATRNAVLSQRDSRIGTNQFLKRQYGAEVGGENSGMGSYSVGQTIQWRGHPYRVKSVDQNGKVTAADPI
ncbi:MAG TPA: hypothetical protein VHX11_07860 [Acidobacteriaceae bacterium]|jgi:hypothetical protein|nr:hypothetical protein [Acidobacteriaceae bacterium]